jgi:hypothetical protein
MERVLGSGLVCAAIALVVASCGSEPRAGFSDPSPTDPSGLGGGEANGGLGQGGCTKGGKTCVGNDIHECAEDGGVGAFVKSCDETGEFCMGGACGSGCEAAESQPTNVGCEFWAVDLDNEYASMNDAAGQPWGVVVSNFGQTPANVIIERNDASVGAAAQTAVVLTKAIAPGQLAEIELPTREVDGSKSKDDGPGTMLSSNAYRIKSDVPVVVYQFNTMRHSYSNDASLLVPKNGLGSQYRVLGWPTANPIAIDIPGAPKIDGIPDHSFVTIVGTAAGTKVRVTLGGPIVGGGGIAALPKGGVVEQVLGPFDVLNLESSGIPGDLSGTIVESNAPVAVFTGGERGIAPMADGPPKPPSYTRDGFCCTDHLEEQLFPVTAGGRSFVITRSPIRSTGGYVEPDLLRFMGVAATTTVKTSLPAPDDTFTLEPGQVRDTWTTKDITVEATEPVMIGQVLVSQGFTENPTEGGDPSLTIFPPVEQYRRDYLFNVPSSWQKNWVVIAAPVGSKVTIDGADPAGCVVAPAGNAGGVVSGKSYEARRCPVGEGAHRMAGNAPFGIVAYGYGSRGSYAFVGGANVRKIYEPPPLK